jgi:hypothetical protein
MKKTTKIESERKIKQKTEEKNKTKLKIVRK